MYCMRDTMQDMEQGLARFWHGSGTLKLRCDGLELPRWIHEF